MGRKREFSPKIARLRSHFSIQQHSAFSRGIGWDLSFEQWLEIWEKSEHLNERGRCREQYCMARFGDKGPYAVGNVRIVTNAQNAREFHSHHVVSTQTREKLSKIFKGRTISVEQRQAVSRANRGRVRSQQFKQHLRMINSGEKNPNARLTQAQADEIRLEYSLGNISMETLGARFGVSGTTVSNIILRRCYVT